MAFTGNDLHSAQGAAKGDNRSASRGQLTGERIGRWFAACIGLPLPLSCRLVYVSGLIMASPRPSLTLSLLQAREAVMAFFRPALNQHDLTEQQWRVIRILRQQGELECHQLARQACILKPSMTGVLNRLERDGLVRRQKSSQDQRRIFVTLTERGRQSFISMGDSMERNYLKIQEQFGAEKMESLLALLNELKSIRPGGQAERAKREDD